MSVKVLHLVDHLNDYCGMSGSTMHMITAVRSRGYEGEIWSGPGDAMQQARDQAIDVTWDDGFSKKKSMGNILRTAAHIHRYVNNHEVDIIHSHHRMLGLIGWFVAQWHGLPIVHTDHNLLYGYGSLSYWGDKVIAVSNLNKQNLHNDFNIPNDKIVTCVEFADLDNLLANPLEEQGAMTHIGQMGRLAEQKGQRYLLNGFYKYLKIKPDATLTIKGDGPLKGDLQEQAQRLGIASSVTFEAPDHDIGAFFEKIDCFLISSIFEGSCTVAAEAAAYGVPIIATRVGGITDYLSDGHNAILIDSKSPEAIVEGLNRMHDLKAEGRQTLVENGKSSIRKVFDREQQAEVLANVYDEVLAAKGRS